MKEELIRAFSAKKHPGMSGATPIRRLVWNALPYFYSIRGYARPPITIYWSINSVCNMACKMCDVGMGNNKSNFYKNLCLSGDKTEVSIETYKQVTKEVASFKPAIAFTSTEPLLYESLHEAISYARSMDMNVAVTTNGYLLSDKAAMLVNAGVSRVNVSVDGPPDVHNRIRGRSDVFERAIEGVRLIREESRKRGVPVEINCAFTITSLNYDKLVAFMDAVDSEPFDAIIFSYMNYVTADIAAQHNELFGDQYHATTNCINEAVNPQNVDIEVLCSQIDEVKGRCDARVLFLPNLSANAVKRYFCSPNLFVGGGRCMASWFIAEIIASGEVIPYTRCYNISFGNVNHQGFMEIWNGDRMRTWRKDVRKYKKYPACTRCDQVVS